MKVLGGLLSAVAFRTGGVLLSFLLIPGSFLILCSIGGSGSWAVFWSLTGLMVVAFVALATNLGGIRERVPLLNSSTRLVRTTGWVWLAIAAILTVAYSAGGTGSCSSLMYLTGRGDRGTWSAVR